MRNMLRKNECYKTMDLMKLLILFLFFLNKSKIELIQINNTLLFLEEINYESAIKILIKVLLMYNR